MHSNSAKAQKDNIMGIPLHLKASLTRAAELDVDIMDLHSVSKDAADHVYAVIGDMRKTAKKRFAAYFDNVPSDVERAAIDFVSTKGDEIDIKRRYRAKIAARNQRIMREKRIAMEMATA